MESCVVLSTPCGGESVHSPTGMSKSSRRSKSLFVEITAASAIRAFLLEAFTKNWTATPSPSSLEKNYAAAVETLVVVKGGEGTESWLVDMLERAVKLNEGLWESSKVSNKLCEQWKEESFREGGGGGGLSRHEKRENVLTLLLCPF